MKIKPLFNQLLIKPIVQKQVLVSPEPSLLMYGEVLDAGPDCKVKKGETVCYTLWGLNHIEIDGQKHYFVPEQREFLLAIIEMPGGVAA